MNGHDQREVILPRGASVLMRLRNGFRSGGEILQTDLSWLADAIDRYLEAGEHPLDAFELRQANGQRRPATEIAIKHRAQLLLECASHFPAYNFGDQGRRISADLAEY